MPLLILKYDPEAIEPAQACDQFLARCTHATIDGKYLIKSTAVVYCKNDQVSRWLCPIHAHLPAVLTPRSILGHQKTNTVTASCVQARCNGEAWGYTSLTTTQDTFGGEAAYFQLSDGAPPAKGKRMLGEKQFTKTCPYAPPFGNGFN